MIDYITGLLGPIFTIALLALGFRAWLGIRGQRITGRQCKDCGYSRVGISIETPCPECGMKQKYPGSILHIRKRKTVRNYKRIAADLLIIVAVIGIAYGSIKLDDYRLGYYNRFVESVRNGDLQTVEHYLDRYPELAEGRFRYVSQFNDSGGPLTYAINSNSQKKAELITLLLLNGANPNGHYHHRAPLAQALWSDQKHETIHALLDAGADPDIIDIHNQSAIAFATWLGDEKSVRLLIEAGAYLNHVDAEGLTALDHAHSFFKHSRGASTPHQRIAELLRSKGAKHADELIKENNTKP